MIIRLIHQNISVQEELYFPLVCFQHALTNYGLILPASFLNWLMLLSSSFSVYVFSRGFPQISIAHSRFFFRSGLNFDLPKYDSRGLAVSMFQFIRFPVRFHRNSNVSIWSKWWMTFAKITCKYSCLLYSQFCCVLMRWWMHSLFDWNAANCVCEKSKYIPAYGEKANLITDWLQKRFINELPPHKWWYLRRQSVKDIRCSHPRCRHKEGGCLSRKKPVCVEELRNFCCST